MPAAAEALVPAAAAGAAAVAPAAPGAAPGAVAQMPTWLCGSGGVGSGHRRSRPRKRAPGTVPAPCCGGTPGIGPRLPPSGAQPAPPRGRCAQRLDPSELPPLPRGQRQCRHPSGSAAQRLGHSTCTRAAASPQPACRQGRAPVGPCAHVGMRAHVAEAQVADAQAPQCAKPAGTAMCLQAPAGRTAAPAACTAPPVHAAPPAVHAPSPRAPSCHAQSPPQRRPRAGAAGGRGKLRGR